MSNAMIRPDVQSFLDSVSGSPLGRFGELSVAETRAASAQMRSAPPVSNHISIREMSFSHAGVEIDLRFFDPGLDSTPRPVLLFFHGGGFVMGDLDSHHQLCQTIAESMRLPLVAVDYRLAPEHPWPAAPDDAEAAARWLAGAGCAALGIKASGLVLAGDSAGANLAAVTARALVDRPAELPLLAQFLMYPCVSVDKASESMRENGEGYFLTRAALDWFTALYSAPSDSPRFNLLAVGQSGMPPTLLVTAEFDPLRDEGRAYGASLVAAGVPLVYHEVLGHIHGCFSMVAAIPSTKRDLDQALAALDGLIDLPKAYPEGQQ